MIPNSTIQEILDTAKIEDVVGDFVQLRRRGVNLIGLCPFHNERTPSFNVSPVRNIYKCFGCGEGGNSVNFIMKHDNCSYPEALRYLAQKYGIRIEEETPSDEYKAQQQLADSLYLINDFAYKYFQTQLFDTDYGQNVGLAYFKQRGLREDTIKRFGLGFANGQQSDLVQTMTAQQYDLELLKKAGLSSQYGRDFFRLRVMYPIHNLGGKVIGFGGRIMTNDKSQPKYINTPESDIYIKNKSLYGIHFAKKEIAAKDECFLVEGYMDVLALHQAGIENTVASSGTSLTTGQIQLIKRYTHNITILYDGDAAGIKAALRGLDLVLEQGMDVKIVLFPDGDDPDSYMQKVGETAFRQYVQDNKSDFILFKSQLLLKDTAKDPIARAHALNELLQSIAKITESLKRAIYIRECAQLFQIEEVKLHQEINKLVGKNIEEHKKAEQKEAEANAQHNPETNSDTQQLLLSDTQQLLRSNSAKDEYQERDIIRILIHFGHRKLNENETVAEFILSNMLELLDEFDGDLYSQIISEYIEALETEKPIDTDYFINHANSAIAQLAVNLLSTPYEYSENWKKLNVFLNTQEMPDLNHERDTKSGIIRFKMKKLEKLMRKNQEQLLALQAEKTAENFEEVLFILKVQQKLKILHGDLAKQMNTVVLK